MHRVRALVAELRAALVELRPDTFAPDVAATFAEELAIIENACGAAKVRLMQRAAECGAHRSRGFADVSDWLANATGTTVPEARRQLETTALVRQCPDTQDAVLNGQVSLAQAHEIARTAREVPGSEGELLDLARAGSLGAVRDQARRRRVEAIDRDELYARQRRAREFRSWRDELGMVRGTFALTPEVGVALVNRIDRETDRLRRAAKRGGDEIEGRATFAADALASLLTAGADSEGTPRARSADLVIVCDLAALRRGRTAGNELCHVIGGGPVPVGVARAALEHDAFVKAVVHDGVQIDTVRHFGRRMPAELRTALELGQMPDLSGTVCVEDGCERHFGLEWDHVDPVAHGGLTSYENLEARCHACHGEKTERDRLAGLLGPHPAREPP